MSLTEFTESGRRYLAISQTVSEYGNLKQYIIENGGALPYKQIE